MLSDTMQKRSNAHDFSFQKEFEYSHNNPYHQRLEKYNDFVLRDSESEKFKGQWKKEIFKNKNPLFLEIGTGYGQFMQTFCELNPSINFIGLDYRFKRSFELAKRLSSLSHRNFRYLRAKGERIEHIFEESELDQIFYFFPDPWPKSRHHKKRLFQDRFIEAASCTLKKQGKLLIKTDHDEYFNWMVNYIENHKDQPFSIEMKTFDLYKDYPKNFLASFQTKFEKIFIQKNIKIKAMSLINEK